MINPATDPGCVAVLLCTFNGGSFLKEQLSSIAAQSHEHWVVYASDDGSTDDTLEILQHYREVWGSDRLLISEGPRQGFSNNFLSVLGQACGHHEYYAFCDQDDRWHPAKLQKALNWLKRQPPETPSLYCGRTQVVDITGKIIGLSPLFKKRPSFENALMQNLAGGNTMLINRAACVLLNETPAGTPLVCHDWWTYLLVSGCGGNVYYDPEPTLDYRQHTQNVIGANTSIKSRATRLKSMFEGSFSEWNAKNIAALSTFSPRLNPHSAASLMRFEQARNAPLTTRIKLMVVSRFYRQTLLGNLGLALAVLIKRI
ncbi:glycosyltransferase family 2 protein [Pseudomonas sp. dw_612]|uniref:glycosyltransferase family 2 protein n=1 Tax=Pseudomonas sp. dw_612 TaxID=2720080 RepID=UPI002116BCB7|nr:glycosyltransferase family 2 protein [Pseudomonas sp. dw_612]